MENPHPSLNWSLVQSFLAVAGTGSLSAAGQMLGASQPTIGRHIKSLEASLGASLFDRHPKGLRLTKLGHDLLPLAENMRETATKFALISEAETGKIAGTVRVASSVFAAHHLLPKVIAELRQVEPEITIVLVASDDSENLLFAEVDIAVRMYRPTQLELITKHLGDIEIGAFAARSYIQRKGRPTAPNDLQNHDIVGFDQSPLILDTMREMGFPADRDMFPVRCDNQTAYWQLVRAGCGIGFSQAHVGHDDPLVEHLELGLDIPPLPIWLAANPSARHVPRVDRVWRFLSEHLPAAVSPTRY